MLFSHLTVIPGDWLGHPSHPSHPSHSSHSRRSDSSPMAVSTGKVWVGPLLLILLIALIYIFSLLPHTHHKNSYIYGDDDQVELSPYQAEKSSPYEMPANYKFLNINRIKSQFCNFRGYAIIRNDDFVGCECPMAHGMSLFSGKKCENKQCLHNGTLVDDTCQCDGPWMGKHCEIRCQGDLYRNGTSATCDCRDGRYGDYCEHYCNEKMAMWEPRSKTCTCFNGYEAPGCVFCRSPECSLAQTQHKKGVVNSRLTLSGLSFCLITIGLLCITARRRRMATTALPGNDETWYRIFQPQAGGRRCRHDFVCGGSWIPRDRALLVGSSNRQPTQARLARNNRSLTPPPSYCSVEHLDGSSGAPPSYDEAIHRNENLDMEIHLDRIIEDVDHQETAEDKEQPIQQSATTQTVTEINEEEMETDRREPSPRETENN